MSILLKSIGKDAEDSTTLQENASQWDPAVYEAGAHNSSGSLVNKKTFEWSI